MRGLRQTGRSDAALDKARLKTIKDHVRQENSQDLKGLLRDLSSDAVCMVNALPRTFVGRKAVGERYQQTFKAFPDYKVTVRKTVAMGRDFVVTENVFSGTHRGSFVGVPPTGKRVHNVRAAVFWSFRGSRLTGEYIYYDLATVLKQLGVLNMKKLANGQLANSASRRHRRQTMA